MNYPEQFSITILSSKVPKACDQTQSFPQTLITSSFKHNHRINFGDFLNGEKCRPRTHRNR